MIELLKLFLKSRIRSDFRKDIVALFIILILCFIIYRRYHNEIFGLLMMLSTRTDNFIIILKYLYLFQCTDFALKLYFKQVIFEKPDLVHVLPIKKSVWKNFLHIYDLLNFWNFYFLIFTIPVFHFILHKNELFVIIGLQIIISFFNSSVIRSLKSFFKNSQYRSIIIGAVVYTLYIIFIEMINSQIATTTYIIVVEVACIIGIIMLGHLNERMVSIAQEQKESKQKIFDFSISHRQSFYSFLLESKYIIRSKRLTQLLLLSTIFMVFMIYRMFLFSDNEPVPKNIEQMFLFIFLIIPSISLGQYVFGAEANFFCGIWTKPIRLHELLNYKYLFYGILSFINVLLLTPLVIMGKIDFFLLIALFLFIAGFVNGLILTNVIIGKKRLELDSSTFLNYQGFSIEPYIYVILMIAVGLGLDWWLINTFGEVIAYFLLSIIGLIFLLSRNYWLLVIIKLFKIQRYSIMDGFRKS